MTKTTKYLRQLKNVVIKLIEQLKKMNCKLKDWQKLKNQNKKKEQTKNDKVVINEIESDLTTETYLLNFLQGMENITNDSNDGENDKVVYLEKGTKNTENTESNRRNIKNLEKYLQLELLYNYCKEKSINGTYRKESNEIISNNFNCSKDFIGKLFKELINKNWLLEMIEIQKSYTLNRKED